MKHILFSGKRKLFTIPLAIILGLTFLPFTIGGLLTWLVYKKVSDKKLQYSAFGIIGLLTLFVGTAWVVGLSTPSKTKSLNSTSPTPIVTSIINKPTPTVLPPTTTPIVLNKQEATLIKIIDGDTITVSISGQKETIRIIGIDTPESVDPRKPVQCLAVEASNYAKHYLNSKGSTVWLKNDPTQGDRDKYQRLLRYVFTDNGVIDFGETMIQLGYASEYTYAIPYKYQSAYKQAEQNAQEGKKGLWADNACSNTATTTTNTQSTQQQNTTNTSGFTSYSGGDKDCKDFTTQAEAQAYFNSKGGSAANNVDRLDGSDHDGIVCEALP